MKKVAIMVGQTIQFCPTFMIILLICNLTSPVKSQNISVIPEPLEYKQLKGEFHFNNKTVLTYNHPEIESLSEYLHSMIQSRFGLNLASPMIRGKKHGVNLIHLQLESSSWKGNREGYSLSISPKKIHIVAGSNEGLFYGIQTLIQIINHNENEKLTSMVIKDEPRFGWRGIMLDVSRHFFSVENVKRLIDQMAEYKFNILHLHLTDDQGWRLEIKSLPELTQIGAWRVPRFGLWWDRKPAEDNELATMGGFYTQQQIHDLITYASARYIQILPEINIPGHSLAAIAAYPWLSTTKRKYKVNPGSRFYGVEDNALSPIQDVTYLFLDKVFTEVAELFPFEYIHIGGDECYKGFWENDSATQIFMKERGIKNVLELQSYFIKRVEKIVQSKGKKIIGWDEIMEGGLAPNAAVMSWRGMQGGITASQEGHKVVMSPFSHAYLDLYQGDPSIEPPTYGMLRLKTVYSFEPLPDKIDPAFVLGGQGNLWTESVPTFRHAEYMLWPRSMALAETLWSSPHKKNWDNFIKRLELHLHNFKERDINFSSSLYDATIHTILDNNGGLHISLETEVSGLDIFYSFDNTIPDHSGQKYVPGETLTPLSDAETFRVITYRNGKPIGKLITVSLDELMSRTK